MTIKKFLHSCVLIESKGQKLLIDPGDYSFVEKRITPEDIGGLDTLLITHEHGDHFSIDAIRKLLSIKSAEIISHAKIAELLSAASITCKIIAESETKQTGPFNIRAVRAPHGGPLVQGPVDNMAFLINGRLLHPGDSIDFSVLNPLQVLFLPVVAPWLVQMHALEKAMEMKPKIAVPIHDGQYKDFALPGMYKRIGEKLAEVDIQFKPLALHEKLEIPD